MNTTPTWNNGSVEYYFMNKYQGILTKTQALVKIGELEDDNDFQIVTGQMPQNFLSIHNRNGED